MLTMGQLVSVYSDSGSYLGAQPIQEHKISGQIKKENPKGQLCGELAE